MTFICSDTRTRKNKDVSVKTLVGLIVFLETTSCDMGANQSWKRSDSSEFDNFKIGSYSKLIFRLMLVEDTSTNRLLNYRASVTFSIKLIENSAGFHIGRGHLNSLSRSLTL